MATTKARIPQSVELKSNRKRVPITVDGNELAVAEWNPNDPRFAHWCEELMGVYSKAAKMQGLDIPDEWLTEMETATDERKDELIDKFRKPFADAAEMIDAYEIAIDKICGDGIADVLFSHGNMEFITEFVHMILGDHIENRGKATAKYRV